jgi:hypothetical protein
MVAWSPTVAPLGRPAAATLVLDADRADEPWTSPTSTETHGDELPEVGDGPVHPDRIEARLEHEPGLRGREVKRVHLDEGRADLRRRDAGAAKLERHRRQLDRGHGPRVDGDVRVGGDLDVRERELGG